MERAEFQRLAKEYGISDDDIETLWDTRPEVFDETTARMTFHVWQLMWGVRHGNS